jgi:hypothetical protein
MDFDAGEEPSQLRYPAGGDAETACIKPVGATMQPDGMEARIAQHNLKPRSGCRIACDDAVYVSKKMLEHTATRNDIFAARRKLPS